MKTSDEMSPPITARRTAAHCAVQVVDVLNATIVIAAIPSIAGHFGVDESSGSLLITGYAVFFGALLALAARIGDRLGHHRMVRLGVVWAGIAALIGALAPSFTVLVAARCLQGAAAAASVPSALRLLVAEPDEGRRRRVVAAWSAAGAGAGALGLVLGGVLTSVAGWQSVFWVTVPLTGLLLVVLPRRGDEPDAGRPGLDLAGAGALVVAVGALVLGAGLVERPESRSLGLVVLLAAVLLVPVVVAIERRATNPLLPVDLVRPGNLRAGSWLSFVNTATTSSGITLAALHLQGQGTSAAVTGVTLVPFSVAVIGGAAAAPRLMAGLGSRRAAAAGLAVVACGIAALAVSGSYAAGIAACVAVAGAGLGVASVAATTIGTDVEDQLQGTASGLLNTAAQLGTGLGVAAVVLAASLAAAADVMPWSGADGAVTGWLVAAAVALVAALPMTLRSRRPH
jgi:MFS family permease